MSWFKKKPELAVEVLVEETVSPDPGDLYEGPVVFSEGAHWPVGFDEAGNEAGPDLSLRLLWRAEEGVYRFAAPEEPTHEHLYQSKIAEITPGVEVS